MKILYLMNYFSKYLIDFIMHFNQFSPFSFFSKYLKSIMSVAASNKAFYFQSAIAGKWASKLSALENISFKHDDQTFAISPTSSPDWSLILKETRLQGPHGRWQNKPHWQQYAEM